MKILKFSILSDSINPSADRITTIIQLTTTPFGIFKLTPIGIAVNNEEAT